MLSHVQTIVVGFAGQMRGGYLAMKSGSMTISEGLQHS